jgi:hypothetical protein
VWLLQLVRIALGLVWAGSLLAGGLWVQQHAQQWSEIAGTWGWSIEAAAWDLKLVAVIGISAAQFIFMVLVADALCPHADRNVTGFLKAFTGVLAVLAMGVLGWGLFVTQTPTLSS